MPVLYYNGENTLRLKGQGDIQFRFVPGANNVPNDIWEHLTKYTDAKAWADAGKLRVIMVPAKSAQPVSVPVPEKAKGTAPRKLAEEAPVQEQAKPLETVEEANIAEMSAPEAVALVEGVLDVAVLRLFASQESERMGGVIGKNGPRKTVVESLDKQMQIAELKINQEQRAGTSSAA